MDPSMMNAQMGHQQYVFYDVKRQQAQFQPHQMYPNVPILSSTHVYSRPNSACSQPHAPTLYSNVPTAMTPMASPQPVTLKPSIMLETEIRDSDAFYPQTPPLSSSGSVAGSPGSVDVLQTPVNPMFSGLDGVKPEFDAFENLKFDFAATSPPLTPLYTFQPVKAHSTTNSSPESCPSLSPSPPPYARSVASSEQEVDFCDPRNLTNPTLAPALATEEVKVETPFNSEQNDFSFDNQAIVNDLLFEDQSDLESLVHLEQITAPSDARRPRAATGSSVLSLGHDSFISEDLSFCDEAFSFPCLPTPTESEASYDSDSHRDKRVRKSPKKEVDMPQVTAAASGSQSSNKAQASRTETETSESKNNGSGSDGSVPPNPPPANRRGRKQSLTEDPSKTFVCDLCNRRFRRQEHLKRHYRSLHTQEKPFECNECGKKFSRSDNLAQHARTHGSGAIVMDLIEDHEAHMFAQPLMGNPDDYRHYGKVLFQVAAEMPGSASDSSEDDLHDIRKKRKRSD